MAHPPDIELLDLLEAQGSPFDAERTVAHLRECQTCRTKVVAMVRHKMDVGLLDEGATDG